MYSNLRSLDGVANEREWDLYAEYGITIGLKSTSRLSSASTKSTKHFHCSSRPKPIFMESTKPRRPPWKALFNFTTQDIWFFLSLAIVSAAASGFTVPMNSYVLPKIIGCFTNFGTSELTSAEFKSEIAKCNIYLVITASACWFFNPLAYCFCHVFGDLQSG